jgi:hypothetical protein
VLAFAEKRLLTGKLGFPVGSRRSRYSGFPCNGRSEVALAERDWKRIEAELDAARPGASETSVPAAADQVLKAPALHDEEQILQHIADALRLDSGQ